jgi:hypothetical protein
MTSLVVTSRKLLIGLSVLLFGFAIASDASARGDRENRRSESTEQEVIDEVDTAARTVTIAGETFAISDSSRLFDERGGRIRLRELHGSVDSDEGDMVEFVVRRGAKGAPLEIRSLKVLAGDYE